MDAILGHGSDGVWMKSMGAVHTLQHRSHRYRCAMQGVSSVIAAVRRVCTQRAIADSPERTHSACCWLLCSYSCSELQSASIVIVVDEVVEEQRPRATAAHLAVVHCTKVYVHYITRDLEVIGMLRTQHSRTAVSYPLGWI